MENTSDKLTKIGVWTTVILFVIRCLPSVSSLIDFWKTRDIFQLAYSVAGYLGEALAIGFLVVKLFDLWIWRWIIIRKLHKIPVLAKTYKGKLESDFDNKIYKGTLSITQTFSKVNIRFKSDESSSYSITATIICNNDVNQLIYTYQNDPKANIQKRSRIHHGTAILNIDNVDKIEGNYFTERGTTGHMTFSSVKEKKK